MMLNPGDDISRLERRRHRARVVRRLSISLIVALLLLHPLSYFWEVYWFSPTNQWSVVMVPGSFSIQCLSPQEMVGRKLRSPGLHGGWQTTIILLSSGIRRSAAYFGARIPFWLLMAAVLPLVLWSWRLGRAIPQGKCQVCGYDLTGNVSGLCSECGVATR